MVCLSFQAVEEGLTGRIAVNQMVIIYIGLVVILLNLVSPIESNQNKCVNSLILQERKAEVCFFSFFFSPVKLYIIPEE